MDFSFTLILEGIAVLGIMGAVFGALLAFAAKIFHVEVDPKQEAVRECLAGANCGGCGYPGCDGYAAAVAAGKAPVNCCVAGGQEAADKIAAIMGYKVGTTANSCSTMHKIQAKEFTFEDFSCEHLDEPSKAILGVVINELNNNRGWYNDYNRLVSEGDFTDVERKQFWWNMIQLLPSSFNQKRTVTMTYENLLNMLEYRRGHKLDEWRMFCDWILTLPYGSLLKEGVSNEQS